jgi:hypothetical protein
MHLHGAGPRASQVHRGFDGQPPRGSDIFGLGMWHGGALACRGRGGLGGGWAGGLAGAVVGAGVVEQGGDGAGVSWVRVGPDGDLVGVVVVEGVDVEGGEQGLLDPVGGVGDDAGEGG